MSPPPRFVALSLGLRGAGSLACASTRRSWASSAAAPRLVGVLDGATWTEAYSAHAGPVRAVASDGRRLRGHKSTETDPQKRAEAVREAGFIIETTARIDTITLGRD